MANVLLNMFLQKLAKWLHFLTFYDVIWLFINVFFFFFFYTKQKTVFFRSVRVSESWRDEETAPYWSSAFLKVVKMFILLKSTWHWVRLYLSKPVCKNVLFAHSVRVTQNTRNIHPGWAPCRRTHSPVLANNHSLSQHAFGRLVETGEPRGNPHRLMGDYAEIMHNKNLRSDSNQGPCEVCEAATLLTEPP